MKIGFQTIVWWPFTDPLEYRLEVIAAAGYQGVEFQERPNDLPPIKELLQLMKKYNLELVGLAGGSLKSRMEYCKYFRPAYLYIEDWNMQIAKIASEEAFTLAIHPHVFKPTHSFERAKQLLKRDPRLKFLPDTAHHTIGGDNPTEVIRYFEGKMDRIAAVHFKDWTDEFGRTVHRYARGFVELGQGIVNLKGVLKVLKEVDYKGWMIMEQEYTKTDPALNTFNCAKWLCSNGLQLEINSKPPVRTFKALENDVSTKSEVAFLKIVASAGWQDLVTYYESIASAFFKLSVLDAGEAEMVAIWTCSPAHRLMHLVAIKPHIGIPIKNILDVRKSLLGETIDEKTILHFDLKNPRIRVSFNWPELLEGVEANWMTSIPIFNPWNPRHVRLVVNIFHNKAWLTLGYEKLKELAILAGYSTSNALDELGATVATQINGLASLSKQLRDFIWGLLSLVKKTLNCEATLLFLRNNLKDDFEIISCEGIGSTNKRIRGWYEVRKKSISALQKRRELVMPRDWWEAVESGTESSLEETSRCIAAPLVSMDGTFLGFICCSGKWERVNLKTNETTDFSDDDEAILEAIVQTAVPKFEMEKILEAHQKALLCITHTINRPLIDIVSGITYLYTKYKGQLDGITRKWLKYVRQTTEDAQVIAGGTSRVFRALVRGDTVRTSNVEEIDPVEETERLANRMNLLEKGHPTDQPNPKRLYIEYKNRVGKSKIRADREGFLFIMYNLLDNAIKYSYKNRYIEVVYEKEGSDLCVKVKSYGVRIPIKPGQEDLPFELFWRGEEQIEYHSKDAIYHPGLGVGLWASRELARASNGDVRLVPHTKEESLDPHYSIFLVRFPLVTEWARVVSGL